MPNMTAQQIIEEIRLLPPPEQEEVVRSVVLLDKARLTGQELSAKATQLSEATSEEEISRLRSELERGFYGSFTHA